MHRLLPLDHRAFAPLLERLRRRRLMAAQAPQAAQQQRQKNEEDLEEGFHRVADAFADE